jgi:cysteine-rich repeat protein
VVEGTCGDGLLNGAEACDDGNGESGDGCSEDCAVEAAGPVCGDGVDTGDEECDDGNTSPGDGCDEECREERCGNSRLDAGEECDPPEAGQCTNHCSFFRDDCGNRVIDGEEGDPRAEQCDDGNDTAGDGCFECRIECGDGRIDSAIGEECDRAIYEAEVCSETCRWQPTCGDGELDSELGEECDPSNGATCVACKVRTAPLPGTCEGGAAGMGGAGGEGGCSGVPTECVLQGAANLLQNGAFATDAAGWLPHSNLVTLGVVDEGDPSPKALDVALTPGQVRVISGAYQCVSVEADRTYQLLAKYRIPSEVPAGVSASVTAILYAGPGCTGTQAEAPATGPSGTVRGAWTPYQLSLDTSALSGPGRLLIRLNALRPVDVSGTRVLWDSVSLTAEGGSCGDCEVGEGETCDDGNQIAGDGCSPSCTLELCGDGVRSPAEQCDDGNSVFGSPGDVCTPRCKSPSSCDACAVSRCPDEVQSCLGLTGEAAAGPRRFVPRATLCDELRTCVQESSCHLFPRQIGGGNTAHLENCYCGTAGNACFEEPGAANGTCRTEVEAALESTDPVAIAGRMSGADARYPAFAAVRDLLACADQDECGTDCVRTPTCGDGFRQDRALTIELVVDGVEVPCADGLTESGRGCRFEECDDGGAEPGGGCDENCLLEVCGNHLVQEGEECEDGNLTDGDGCSSDCQSEFDCGNSVQEPGEACDPPGGEHVCSAAEFASNPSLCACDSECERVVCGDGKLRRPLEACDPPNGFTCGDDCQLLPLEPCQQCISETPEVGALIDDEYCNIDPQCIAAKQCMIQGRCTSTYAQCYCGPDTSAFCENESFVPTGPCHELIASLVGPPGLTNAEILGRMPLPTNPWGMAQVVLSEAAQPQYCYDVCYLCPDFAPGPCQQ